jgi:hypothetical protein
MGSDAAILFLDNSPEKIKQVHSYCSSADTILVKETPESRVVKLLESVGLSLKGSPSELRMRYKSAINERTVARIKEWVEQHSAQQKYVLFDWGRTLTQLEGIRLTPMKVANYERILEFICGGANRVQLLRDMFQYLHKNDCSIYMLTNNKHCGAAAYKGLVEHLAGVPLKFICSGASSAAGHKGVAMQQHHTFKKFCKGKGESKRQYNSATGSACDKRKRCQFNSATSSACDKRKRCQFNSATSVRKRCQTRKRTHK